LFFSSIGQANNSSGVPHFETKFEIETHIKTLDINYTIVRPTAFFENFDTYIAPKNGSVSIPFSPDVKVQYVALDDLGEVVARIFESPKDFLFKEFELAGDELTGHQLIETFSKILKQPIYYKQSPPLFIIKLISRTLYLMILFFEKQGYNADIHTLRQKFPGLRTLEAWLIETNFESKYNAKGSGWFW